MEHTPLPVGTKSGCLTIIAGYEAYQEEVAKGYIDKFEEEKQKFLNGESSSWHTFSSVDTFDRMIADYKSKKKYKCQCKCGKIHYMEEAFFLQSKWRHCAFGHQSTCGLKEMRERKKLNKYARKIHPSYEKNLLGDYHDTLEIVECISEHYEGPLRILDGRKTSLNYFPVYKLYKCRCHLCQKEYLFRSDAFTIHFDSYGSRAKEGYYCDTYCDCHEVSSFQWRTIDIFQKYGIRYKAEVSFSDLYGTWNQRRLRYDFAILDTENSIKMLIECQGQQHYQPVSAFGGKTQYSHQIRNDEAKRLYAKEHNIPYIEIPYTCNTYDKEVRFLQKQGVISTQ